MNKITLLTKRLIDFIGSLFGLILISPLLIIISILIKFTSKGPIFFQQERLGQYGEIFNIFKFRTMVVNAEKMGDGLSVKTKNDNRITKVGKVLRATSLDELPQLFNVLIGNMSLVGPRPPVTYHPYSGYEQYPEWAKKRFLLKPGMTGLAQITVRNAVSWQERIKVDNEYIDSFNIWFDIQILFKTFLKLFKTQDIYMDYEKNQSSRLTEKGDLHD